MNYVIDKSLSFDGLYSLTSESGSHYLIKMNETSPNSGLWSVNFIKEYGNPQASEIFKTFKLLADICNEHIFKNGGTKIFLLISGDPEESLKKSKAFVRWLKNDWDCIVEKPNIMVPGTKNRFITTTYYSIVATKKNKPASQENFIESNLNSVEIKFCFNCGTPNNNFVFCPGCGTKLKQS